VPKLTLAYEPWRLDPLVFIHRAEARAIAAELAAAGMSVRCSKLDTRSLETLRDERPLLRVSDARMLAITQSLSETGIAYIGPDAAVLERCYDKYEATERVRANGIDTPASALAGSADGISGARILKPRRGSDSIGVRLIGARREVPAVLRTADYLVQEQIFGTELTVTLIGARVGTPLWIKLPYGKPYSFLRKYLLRPKLAPVEDAALIGRVRSTALRIIELLGADWATRIDLMQEASSGRLVFLECDAAPLIGERSAFAASLTVAGITRAEQWQLLLAKRELAADDVSRSSRR
jgi:D-alanine-D-alanine ligase-like ATP-grasp enzyme